MSPSLEWIRNPPQWLVDWSQIGGAAFSLLALIIALFAIGVSKRDIGKERRRQHELEILRQLGELLEVQHFATQDEELAVKRKIAAQLMMVPVDDFPMVRAAISAGATRQQMLDFKPKMIDYLQDPSRSSALDDDRALSPNLREEEILNRASGYDKLRWEFVTIHNAHADRHHIYGYTSDSIATRELFDALGKRLR